MVYIVIRGIIRIFLSLFFRFNVQGLENVPHSEPVVLCSNHISNLDPLTIGCSMKRKVHFMAKAELFRIPLISLFIRKLGAFPVKRGKLEPKTLRFTIQLLKDGKVLGIFPEGTRSKTGELGEGHSGVALFAIKTNSPIIPTTIIGPYRFFHPIRVVFGKPIMIDDYTNQKISSDILKNITQQVMKQIEKQLEQNENNL